VTEAHSANSPLWMPIAVLAMLCAQLAPRVWANEEAKHLRLSLDDQSRALLDDDGDDRILLTLALPEDSAVLGLIRLPPLDAVPPPPQPPTAQVVQVENNEDGDDSGDEVIMCAQIVDVDSHTVGEPEVKVDTFAVDAQKPRMAGESIRPLVRLARVRSAVAAGRGWKEPAQANAALDRIEQAQMTSASAWLNADATETAPNLPVQIISDQQTIEPPPTQQSPLAPALQQNTTPKPGLSSVHAASEPSLTVEGVVVPFLHPVSSSKAPLTQAPLVVEAPSANQKVTVPLPHPTVTPDIPELAPPPPPGLGTDRLASLRLPPSGPPPPPPPPAGPPPPPPPPRGLAVAEPNGVRLDSGTPRGLMDGFLTPPRGLVHPSLQKGFMPQTNSYVSEDSPDEEEVLGSLLQELNNGVYDKPQTCVFGHGIGPFTGISLPLNSFRPPPGLADDSGWPMDVSFFDEAVHDTPEPVS